MATYYVLRYDLQDGLKLGFVVGSEYVAYGSTDRELLSHCKTYLESAHGMLSGYTDARLPDARLKVLEVEYRPFGAARTYGAIYASATLQTLQIPLVYARQARGGGASAYFCYLPFVNEEFWCLEARHRDRMAIDRARTILSTAYLNRLQQGTLLHLGTPELLTLEADTQAAYNDEPDGPQDDSPSRLLSPLHLTGDRAESLLPDIVYHRDAEVRQLRQLLTQPHRQILVVGRPGVGKSSVLRQALREVQQRSRKSSRPRHTIYRLLPRRITANAKYLGEWQGNIDEMVEAVSSERSYILVEDLLELLQTGGSTPAESAAAYMLPLLASGQLRLVGELTPEGYQLLQQRLPAFARVLEVVQLQPLDEVSAIDVFMQLAAYLRRYSKIVIPSECIYTMYRMLERYLPYEAFPGKGIRLLEQLVERARRQRQPTITEAMVISQFSAHTGLPRVILDDEVALSYEQLQSYFEGRIIGQPEACRQLGGVVQVYKAGLNDASKPIHTMLFAGPTGVGKTESAKALADFFFGERASGKRPLFTIDMSEYKYPFKLSRLLGQGSEVGALVTFLRTNPFSVLLLDEVEKAHPSVYDKLLTAFDEGYLTDDGGRTVWFTNCIIIMTTNLGASASAAVGFGQRTEAPSARYLSAIRRFFRPELINRIDAIVPFGALQPEHIRDILQIELRKLHEREGFRMRDLQLDLTTAAQDYLIRKGYSERYGARQLTRTLEAELVEPLGMWLLTQERRKIGRVGVDVQRDRVTFS